MTKLTGELGLARRGGFITFGSDLIFKLQKGRVHLVLIASDASVRGQKDVDQYLKNTSKIVTEFTKEELGLMIASRPINALGITSAGLAKKIKETLRKEGEVNVENYQEEKE